MARQKPNVNIAKALAAQLKMHKAHNLWKLSTRYSVNEFYEDITDNIAEKWA